MVAGVAAALGWLWSWTAVALHTRLVLPLVQWWEAVPMAHAEESTKAFIREAFGLLASMLNDAGAWVLSAVDASYADTQRRAWQQQEACQNWWREDRTSTLNAVVANAQLKGSLEPKNSLGASSSRGGSASGAAAAKALAATSARTTSAARQDPGSADRGWSLASLLQRRTSSIIDCSSGSATPGSSPRAADAGGMGPQQAGGAASGSARAPQPSLLSRASRHAARRDYAKRREQRAAALEAAGWWGVHEALNRTGLLEDARLSLEVAVTRVFEWVRWLVRCVTMSLKPDGPARGGPARPRAPAVSDPTPRVRRGSAGSPDRIQPPAPLQLRGRRRPVEGRQRQQDSSGDDRSPTRPQALAARVGPSPLSAARRSPEPRRPLFGSLKGWRRASPVGRGHSSDDSGDDAPNTTAEAAADQRGRQQTGSGGGGDAHAPRPGIRLGGRSRSFSGLETLADESHRGRPMTKLRRTRSVGRFDHAPWDMPWETGAEDSGEWESPTAHVIRMAGYPLETYTVVTEDGYVLRMERIPRPGAPDVALFMHGILDTSLTWVSSGVTGSQAFAAWDQGFDVWLGSSRSNPHAWQRRQGMGYWEYTINELGVYDVAAQIDKLHEVKLQELRGRDPRLDLRYAGDLAGSPWPTGASLGRPSCPANVRGPLGPLPRGEALFGGAGVSAPGGRPPHRLRIQRSFSDQAIASGATSPTRSPRRRGDDGAAASKPSKRSGLGAWLRRKRAPAGGPGSVAPSGSGGEGRRQRAGSGFAGRVVKGAVALGSSMGLARSGARPPNDGSPHEMDHSSSKQQHYHQQQQQQQGAATDGDVSCQGPRGRNRNSLGTAIAASLRGAFGGPGRRASEADGVPTPCEPATPDATERALPPPHEASPVAAHAAAGTPVRTPFSDAGAQGTALASIDHHHSQQQQHQPAALGEVAPLLEEPSGGKADDGAPTSPSGAVTITAVASTAALAATAAAAAAASAAVSRAGSSLSLAGLAAASPAAVDVDLLASRPDSSATPSDGMVSPEPPGAAIRRAHSSQAIFTLARSGGSGASLAALAAAGSRGSLSRGPSQHALPRLSPSGSSAALQQRGDGAAAPPAAPKDPYNLRVVAHSLGGASLLIYLVMRLRTGVPHHISRLILLTPAGFHGKVPWVFWPVLTIVPTVWRILQLFLGAAAAAPIYIPTSAARLLTFKFMLDFARLPALGALMRAFMRFSLNGDRSQWDRAVQMPHYNSRSMPAVSLHQGLHFYQLWRTNKFLLYDYGSPAANMARYGHPTPPDLASEYWRIDVPVDVAAGAHDGVIPPANVRRHVSAMRAAGVDVSYREFDFGHLDFTLSFKDELRYFVLQRLMRDKK